MSEFSLQEEQGVEVGNSKSKVLVFVIHHFISAEELNVAPRPRQFMTLVFLFVPVLLPDPDVLLKEEPSCDLLDVTGTAWCLSSGFWNLQCTSSVLKRRENKEQQPIYLLPTFLPNQRKAGMFPVLSSSL